MDEKFLRHLVAAQINDYGTPHVALITPYEIKDNGLVRYYWYDGPSRSSGYYTDQTPERGQFTILRDYGVAEDTDEWWDAADLDFLTTYHAISPIDPAPDSRGEWQGWISPEGDYYLVKEGDHDASAKVIVASLLGRVLSGFEARELLLKDWIKLYQAKEEILPFGRIDNTTDRYDITKAQVSTLEIVKERSGMPIDYQYRDIV